MTQRLKPRSVAARRCAAPLALLCLIAPGAWAETVHTKRGERLVGEVIEETLAEVVLKTRYGVLTIPAEAIERVEREGAAAAEAEAEPGLSPEALEAHRAARAQLVALRLKARRSVGLGKLAEALARYQEILALDPADAAALLELGALQVRMEDPDEAVSTLRRAVLAGFTDLERLRRSDELAPLREHAGFQQLLAQRRGLVRLAARRTPDRLTRKLRERGAGSEYRVARSAEHELVYVHALDEQALAAVRAEVEGLVRLARRDVFASPPSAPLFVALLSADDRDLLPNGVGASFDPERNVLLCAPLPFGALSRAPAARTELMRALHAGDQQARQQQHPAWLVAGLPALLGNAAPVDDALEPWHSPRLSALLQEAARPREADAADAPWGGLLDATPRGFAARADGALEARSLLLYLRHRGVLGRFYDEYTRAVDADGAAGGLRAFEAVLGQAAGVVEGEARAWLATLPAAEVPFTGLVTTEVRGGLRVTYVQPESGGARAGLRVGDVLSALDGAALEDEDDLRELLAPREVGDAVEVRLQRGRVALDARVALAAPPRGPVGPQRQEAPYLGVAVHGTDAGVTVRSVDAESPAAAAGVQIGDVLERIGAVDVPTVRSWLRALRVQEPGAPCTIVLQRAGERVTIEVQLAPAGD